MVEITDAVMLVKIRDAIQATLLGQEFRLGDKWLTRPSLKELRAMEKEYQQRTSTGPVLTGVTLGHG